MAIVKCEGPNGQPGFRYDPGTGTPGECHLYDPTDETSRAPALRAAARDANMAASGGDPRMARDG